MASSKVDICNLALIRLGADTISSLEDENTRARLCNTLYEPLRRRRLRAHPWRFAIARAELAEDAETPEFGFAHQFPLPTGCLRVISIEDDSLPYQIEGRMLLTDASEVSIKYIRDINVADDFSEQDFDDVFVGVLALDIAVELARHLTQSESVIEEIKQERSELLRDARSFDAQEGTPEDVVDDVWINARY